ncbi:MAG: peptidylprolyl isomerase [Candidatus Eisenbacteria bacterium]
MRSSPASVAVVVVCTGLLVAACLLAGCSKEKARNETKAGQTAQSQQSQSAQAPQMPQEKEQPKVVQPAPPGTIRASHILISYKGVAQTEATRTKAEAQKLAQDLLARVRKGENFEELAKTYSDCPSAPGGGDLGFFRKGQMVPPFNDAAFALKPGQVSGIVETDFGYHIINRTQ